MSFLAEPRRKQRLSIDPQNLQWSNDQQRIGQQMMERMGWRGGGLGKNEEGMSENIRVRANHTQKGLGATKISTADGGRSDPWLAHHDEFAQILVGLNEKKKRKEESKESGGENRKKLGVDAISPTFRKSRKRIHYQRLVRPKDVSGFTEQQKCAIFGPSSRFVLSSSESSPKIIAEREQKVVEENPEEKKEHKNGLQQKSENDGSTTKAPMTMDLYFARKLVEMASRRKTRDEMEMTLEEDERGGDGVEQKRRKKRKGNKVETN